eukprot:COSAG05_NODE_1478_length_4772_cov_14.903921_2_plen_109_part_00
MSQNRRHEGLRMTMVLRRREIGGCQLQVVAERRELLTSLRGVDVCDRCERREENCTVHVVRPPHIAKVKVGLSESFARPRPHLRAKLHHHLDRLAVYGQRHPGDSGLY